MLFTTTTTKRTFLKKLRDTKFSYDAKSFLFAYYHQLSDDEGNIDLLIKDITDEWTEAEQKEVKSIAKAMKEFIHRLKNGHLIY